MFIKPLLKKVVPLPILPEPALFDASISSSAIDVISNGIVAKGLSGVSWSAGRVTPGVTTGKWYWEAKYQFRSGSRVGSGITTTAAGDNTIGDTEEAMMLGHNVNAWGGWQNEQSPEFGENDIIMHALDMDNGKFWFGLNGSWYTATTEETTSDPTTLTPHATFATGTFTIRPTVRINSIDEEMKFISGANGFTYAVPFGFTQYNRA